MLDKMLNNSEKKLFSKKYIEKIRESDFPEYIAMYESQLESLKRNYDPTKYKNPIVEELIRETARLVDDLNEYYYTKVIVERKKPKKDEVDIEMDTVDYDNVVIPLDKELTRELNDVKKYLKELGLVD